ncbi:MAG: LytTR family DNA-binding domain-containing protein [Bacteroidia bacterium]|nr:LytTR family DNA-binding domain-containing protein [Bacteroidia bacterium]
MKCIIAEDEAVAARRMQKLLEENDIEVLRVCKSIIQIKSAVEEIGEPDLYFFDIHLSDGIVFEVFELCTLKSPVIFTTAFDQYAIKAFKQNSVDYLLKPIDRTELKNALNKYKAHHGIQTTPDLGALSQMIFNQISNTQFKERFRIKIGDRLRSVQTKDIILFYSKDKINYLATENNRSYPLDLSLDELSSSLDPKMFFRINRSAIVNIEFIENVISYTNSRLKIEIAGFDHEELIVARDRVKKFKEWLG